MKFNFPWGRSKTKTFTIINITGIFFDIGFQIDWKGTVYEFKDDSPSISPMLRSQAFKYIIILIRYALMQALGIWPTGSPKKTRDLEDDLGTVLGFPLLNDLSFDSEKKKIYRTR